MHNKDLLKDLPTHPGVYLMADDSGTIIYVGKANNIKKRVSQYFKSTYNDLKTKHLVSNIHLIDHIITNNAHSALILENQLIKKHQPRFNILLKDDKSYPYIKITLQNAYPRIIITRKKLSDGARYFGPYTSYGSSKALKQLLYDLFPIRDCKQHIDLVKNQKKCILLDIGKCIGPCIFKHIKNDYDHIVKQCINFLNGKNSTVIKSLTHQMQQLSSEKKFEQAALIRNKIQRLQQIQDQRSISLPKKHHYFFIHVASNEHYHYAICQHFSNQQFLSQYGRYTTLQDPLTSFTEEFFNQLTLSIGNKKSTLVMSDKLQQLFHRFYSVDLFPNIHISTISMLNSPEHDTLKLTQLNGEKALIGLSKTKIKQLLPSPVDQLQQALSLPKRPTIIFGCDVSHYYGTQIVSSVVVFIDGKPNKQYYRHFKIKSLTSGKSNDVKAIKETVLRLLDHFSFEPDLLLIDGGKGQLNASLQALKSKEATIPCISLAKKNEEIYSPFFTKPIRLPFHHTGLNLLRYVRDESHRFALKFQRSQRKIE